MRRPPPPASGTETAAAVALALVAGVAVSMWAGGSAAVALWTGRWPDTPPSEAAAVLTHAASPRSVWRSAPTGVIEVGEAAGCAASAAAIGAALTLRRRRGRRSWTTPRTWTAPRAGTAHRSESGWARWRDLDPLRVRGPTSGRLTLGTSRGALLAAERRASVVVLGPSQSGKTSGFAIPAILEWQGPVIATSVKTDLVRDTITARRRRGETWVYDPTACTGLPAAGWSPLDGSTTWQGARRTAAWLCGASRTNPGGGEEDFWYAAAGKLLAPYLLAARAAERDMGEVVRWIDQQEQVEVAELLDEGGHHDALRAAGASWQRDERTRSSVFTTAEMVLEAYADPCVLASATSTAAAVDPVRLLDGGEPTLYVCAPGHEQDRLRPVFATLLQTMISAAYDASLRRGDALDPPLLIVLDEAANIAPLRDLDAIASTAAGHGVQLVTVWQDLAQVKARYGERASTVLNNHRAKIVLSGISDPATLEYASRLIGDGRVRDDSVTIDPSGGRSTTRSSRDRALAPDAELRRIRPGEGVLVYGHLPPARISLRPWFTQRRKRRGRESGSGIPRPP